MRAEMNTARSQTGPTSKPRDAHGNPPIRNSPGKFRLWRDGTKKTSLRPAARKGQRSKPSKSEPPLSMFTLSGIKQEDIIYSMMSRDSGQRDQMPAR
jgi:hypothetical protein